MQLPAGLISVTSVTLVTLVTLAGLVGRASARCPAQCHCQQKASDCSHARLSTVPILLDPRIHVLRLQGNRIDSVAHSLGFYSHLRLLDLSNNSLTSLLEQQFVMQQELQVLKVQNNLVGTLMRETFEGLGRLIELDMSDNMLTGLDAGVFGWLDRLKRLNLAGNRIRTVSRDAFENLNELVDLDLAANRITHVPADAFRHLGGLRALTMRANRLQEVPFHAFYMLQSLRNLSLADNRIYRIHPEAFTDLLDLKVLDFSHNELDKFPATSLALPGLDTLDAGGNRFSSLMVHHMDSLRRLRVLRLCNSATLASVSGNVFSNNLLLEEVHVCENPQLAWLSGTTVDSLPRLKVLNVGGNALATLDNVTDALRRVNLFNVSGNPIVCNCSMRWLGELSARAANWTVVVPVRCVDSGRLVGELGRLDFGCSRWLAPALVAVAAFVVILCAAFVALLVLRRRRRRDRQLTCVRDGCARSYSNQWEDVGSESDQVKEMFTQVDPRYGSLTQLEHFTFQNPDYQKKIPVTVV